MSKVLEMANLAELEQKLQHMIENARSACSINGEFSSECAAAWDAVEEMQAATADRKLKKETTDFERYCIERPDALECRIYDV